MIKKYIFSFVVLFLSIYSYGSNVITDFRVKPIIGDLNAYDIFPIDYEKKTTEGYFSYWQGVGNLYNRVKDNTSKNFKGTLNTEDIINLGNHYTKILSSVRAMSINGVIALSLAGIASSFYTIEYTMNNGRNSTWETTNFLFGGIFAMGSVVEIILFIVNCAFIGIRIKDYNLIKEDLVYKINGFYKTSNKKINIKVDVVLR